MAHRMWKETKQEPGTAGPDNMPCCCLVSFHFLWAVLSSTTVDDQQRELLPRTSNIFVFVLLPSQPIISRLAKTWTLSNTICPHFADKTLWWGQRRHLGGSKTNLINVFPQSIYWPFQHIGEELGYHQFHSTMSPCHNFLGWQILTPEASSAPS